MLNIASQRMALNSFQLFLTQVQSAPEVLKTRVLQIIFDMLMVHEADFMGRGGAGVGVDLHPITKSTYLFGGG